MDVDVKQDEGIFRRTVEWAIILHTRASPDGVGFASAYDATHSSEWSEGWEGKRERDS
jgi:hypothetical protein